MSRRGFPLRVMNVLVRNPMMAFAPAAAAALLIARAPRAAPSAPFRIVAAAGSAITGNAAPTDLQALPGTVSVVTISRSWPGSACRVIKPSLGS